MKPWNVVPFAIVAVLVAAGPASAVPANPVDASSVTLLPADGTPDRLRKPVAAFGREIAKINDDASGKRTALRQQLLEGFDKAIAKAQSSGDLETVLAIKAAKENFDTLSDSDVPFVKSAIAFREKKTSEIESARLSDALKAAKDLNDQLDAVKKDETKKGALDTALMIAEHQKKLQTWAQTLRSSDAGVGRSNVRKEVPLPDAVPIRRETSGLAGSSPDANRAGARRELAVGSKKIALRWCPAGTFLMGAPVLEKDRCDGETLHTVTLTQGFWMGETEVTQGIWMEVMDSNPSFFGGGEDHPVENVSWDDCQAFLSRLNERPETKAAGLEFSLPTEAQWEYACRAGSTEAYGGTGRLEDMGWFNENSGNRPHAVAQKKPNAWGLYDMHGNVWEWCSDAPDQYSDGDVVDPTGTGGNRRALRGGACWRGRRDARSAYRNNNSPHIRFKIWGFRLLAKQKE